MNTWALLKYAVTTGQHHRGGATRTRIHTTQRYIKNTWSRLYNVKYKGAKMHKEDGFTHLGILLAVIMLLAVGSVGAMVYNSSKDKNSTTQSVSDKYKNTSTSTNAQPPKTDQPAQSSDPSTKPYTNPAKKISLSYPSDWQVDKAAAPNDGTDIFVTFSTADYKKGDISIGGEGVLAGAVMTVSTSKPLGTNVQEDYKQPKFAADVTNTTLGGEPAVRYFLAYEGALYSHAVAYHNGTSYNVMLYYPQNDGNNTAARAKFDPIFLKLLTSFKFD